VTQSIRYLAVTALGVLFVGFGPRAAAGTTIDFEIFSPGAKSSDFLIGYGISAVESTGGTPFEVHDFSGDADIQAPSGMKVFLPSGGSAPAMGGMFFTSLIFSAEIPWFQFSTIAEVNEPYTYSNAGWVVRAFDVNDGIIDEIERGFNEGIDLASPLTNEVHRLHGSSNIKWVMFGVSYNFQSTSGTVALDDFVFEPVPEPAALSLVLVGSVLLFAMMRRSRWVGASFAVPVIAAEIAATIAATARRYRPRGPSL
jgi:hypothetical protein